jgi:hypothetical protein
VLQWNVLNKRRNKMAANKTIRIGPIQLGTTTTTNLFNPPTLTGGTNPPALSTASYVILRHIRVSNNTTGALQFATWVGSTGVNTTATAGPFPGIASAGTLTNGVSVAANSYVDWYGILRMDTADFLVGGALTSAVGLTLEAEGEIGVAG